MKTNLHSVVIAFLGICFSFALTAQNQFPDSYMEQAKQQKNIAIKKIHKANGLEKSGADNHRTELIFLGGDDFVTTEILYQEWNNEMWENFAKTINSFNENGHMVEQLSLVWVGDDWQNSINYSITNNAMGYPAEVMGFIWNVETSAWDEMFKMIYTYEGSLLKEFYMEVNFGGVWTPSSKFLFSHDNSGNIIEQLSLVWDFMNSIWENDTREVWTYQNNMPMTLTGEIWEGGAWQNYEYSTWTYDGGWHLMGTLEQMWESGSWVNYMLTSITYDGNWQETEILDEMWEGGAWENWQFQQNEWDGNGNMIQSLIQRWEAKGWINYEMQDYTYTLVGVDEYSVSSGNTINLSSAPNPFCQSTTITFEIQNVSEVLLQVFDMSGKLVTTICSGQMQEGKHDIRWKGTNQSGQKPPNGVYFYFLSAEGNIATSKIELIN